MTRVEVGRRGVGAAIRTIRSGGCSLLLLAVGCQGPELGSMRLEQVAALGDSSGPGAIPTWPRVSARHPSGFRIAVPQPGTAALEPMVYDDGGNYLGVLDASMARAGFVQPLFARIAPDQTIWVFDGAARALIFDATRKYVRTIALPIAPWDAAILPDGRLAVTSSSYSSPLPWLMLRADGTEIRRFGEGTESIPSPRRILAGRNGTVWTLTMTHRQRLEHWDTTGTLIAAFEPTAAWFTPYERVEPPSADIAPQGSVQDGWIDADGRIWVVGKAADANWVDGLGASIAGATPILKPDRAYDTVVEVHDPRTGEVIHSARLDGSYPFVAGEGMLMRARVIEGGWFRAELAAISLVDHDPKQQ